MRLNCSDPGRSKLKKLKLKKPDTSKIKSEEALSDLKSKPKKPSASKSEVKNNLKVKTSFKIREKIERK